MISREELEKQIKGIDKNAVEMKLREMGYGDIANKLNKTSNQDLIRMISKNPDILKKVNQMMGGSKNGR